MPSTEPIKRVGMLFSGGPAPAANAVISAATLSFLNAGIEVIGFFDGYEDLERYSARPPLVEGRDYMCLTRDDVSPHPQRQRHHPAHLARQPRQADQDASTTWPIPRRTPSCVRLRRASRRSRSTRSSRSAATTRSRPRTTSTACRRSCRGCGRCAFVHLPKTIDNDYNGIDWTFGFISAADFAAKEIRNLGEDAKSTQRVVRARDHGPQGRLAHVRGWHRRRGHEDDLGRGLSAPVFDLNDDCRRDRASSWRRAQATAASTASSASPRDSPTGCPTTSVRKETDEHGNIVLGSAQVGKLLASHAREALRRERTGRTMKVRHKQIGYEVRCAEPIAFDVLLGTQLGVGAYRALVEEGLSGVMVSVEHQLQLKYVPFGDLIDPGDAEDARSLHRPGQRLLPARALARVPGV